MENEWSKILGWIAGASRGFKEVRVHYGYQKRSEMTYQCSFTDPSMPSLSPISSSTSVECEEVVGCQKRFIHGIYFGTSAESEQLRPKQFRSTIAYQYRGELNWSAPGCNVKVCSPVILQQMVPEIVVLSPRLEESIPATCPKIGPLLRLHSNLQSGCDSRTLDLLSIVGDFFYNRWHCFQLFLMTTCYSYLNLVKEACAHNVTDHPEKKLLPQVVMQLVKVPDLKCVYLGSIISRGILTHMLRLAAPTRCYVHQL